MFGYAMGMEEWPNDDINVNKSYYMKWLYLILFNIKKR